MASIFYRYPRIYELMIKVMHGKNLEKRYRIISQEIGKCSVLDIGCGTSILKKFLDPECDYEGFDLNQKFINFAAKRKINARRQSIFDFDNYVKKDIIVACDILHHIYPKHKDLIHKISKFAGQKIIVCEPFYRSLKENTILRKIEHNLGLIFDNDGFNCSKDKRNQRWYTERELRNFFFSQIKHRKSLKIRKIGNDIIAIYELCSCS